MTSFFNLKKLGQTLLVSTLLLGFIGMAQAQTAPVNGTNTTTPTNSLDKPTPIVLPVKVTFTEKDGVKLGNIIGNFEVPNTHKFGFNSTLHKSIKLADKEYQPFVRFQLTGGTHVILNDKPAYIYFHSGSNTWFDIKDGAERQFWVQDASNRNNVALIKFQVKYSKIVPEKPTLNQNNVAAEQIKFVITPVKVGR